MSKFDHSGEDVSAVINHILVVIAMEDEAKPFLSKLEDLAEIPCNTTPSPFKFYSGKIKGFQVTVALNGKCRVYGVDNVGTTPGTIDRICSDNLILMLRFCVEIDFMCSRHIDIRSHSPI